VAFARGTEGLELVLPPLAVAEPGLCAVLPVALVPVPLLAPALLAPTVLPPPALLPPDVPLPAPPVDVALVLVVVPV